jgi:hypothetical protein
MLKLLKASGSESKGAASFPLPEPEPHQNVYQSLNFAPVSFNCSLLFCNDPIRDHRIVDFLQYRYNFISHGDI